MKELDRLGIHLFDGADVINYAVARQNTQGTRNYSYRLFETFNAGLEFGTDFKKIRRPAAVLVGSADEQVVADQFAPLFQSLDVHIPVIMIATPTAAQGCRECRFAAQRGSSAPPPTERGPLKVRAVITSA